MSDNLVLLVEERSGFGRDATRRTRRAGKVPTVLYGHDAEPRHLDTPGHNSFFTVRGTKNALVELGTEDKTQLTLVKDVQVHPMRRHALCANFLAVKADEEVDAEVLVVVVGKSTPGTVHSIGEFTILVKAPATSIPESLEASVEGAEAGSAMHVSDLLLLAGVEVEPGPEAATVTVQEVAPEGAEEATEEAAVEGGAEGDTE